MYMCIYIYICHKKTHQQTPDQQNMILRFWQNHIRDHELDHLIVGAAEDRTF